MELWRKSSSSKQPATTACYEAAAHARCKFSTPLNGSLGTRGGAALLTSEGLVLGVVSAVVSGAAAAAALLAPAHETER